jgi:hypothetical protein
VERAACLLTMLDFPTYMAFLSAVLACQLSGVGPDMLLVISRDQPTLPDGTGFAGYLFVIDLQSDAARRRALSGLRGPQICVGQHGSGACSPT